MRKYQDEQETILESVQCNHCGRMLRVEDGILKEGCFQSKYQFGYFSMKDGQQVCFDLCEDCFNGITDSFLIPVESDEIKEYL